MAVTERQPQPDAPISSPEWQAWLLGELDLLIAKQEERARQFDELTELWAEQDRLMLAAVEGVALRWRKPPTRDVGGVWVRAGIAVAFLVAFVLVVVAVVR